MRIQTLEPAIALELPAKAESGKKEGNDLFALLLAALAGVQVTTDMRTVPTSEQQTTGEPSSQIEDLLRALPEGTTVEQLLLNLPKESPVMGALLTEFSSTLHVASNDSQGMPREVADDSPGPKGLPEIAGESTLDFVPEIRPLDKDLTPPVPSAIMAAAAIPLELNPGQPRDEQSAVNEPRQQSPDLTLQPERVEAAPVMSGEAPQAAVPATSPLPVVSAQSLQQLRTEIISFSNNPIRPTITLEVSPPEYGRVMVSAERDAGGQVIVRLIVETPAAKEAMAQQLPQALDRRASCRETV